VVRTGQVTPTLYNILQNTGNLIFIFHYSIAQDYMAKLVTCCDRFDGTSDMNAATQWLGTDLGASYAMIFEYKGQRNINPLLRNVYKQNAYFCGNEYIEKPLLRKRNRG
jgi:hypothetical protein